MTRLHKNVGKNPEEIPGGRLLAPGETAEVDENDPHIKMFVDDGTFVDVHADVPPDENDETKTTGGGKTQ